MFQFPSLGDESIAEKFQSDVEHLPPDEEERLEYWKHCCCPGYGDVIISLVGASRIKAQKDADQLQEWICDVEECISNNSESQLAYVTQSLIKPHFTRMVEEYKGDSEVMLGLKWLALSHSGGGPPPHHTYFFVDQFPFMFETAWAEELVHFEIVRKWREELGNIVAKLKNETVGR